MNFSSALAMVSELPTDDSSFSATGVGLGSGFGFGVGSLSGFLVHPAKLNNSKRLSNNVKYFVTRKNGTEMAQSLFGNENYVEVPNNTNLPTTIIIYEHVI